MLKYHNNYTYSFLLLFGRLTQLKLVIVRLFKYLINFIVDTPIEFVDQYTYTRLYVPSRLVFLLQSLVLSVTYWYICVDVITTLCAVCEEEGVSGAKTFFSIFSFFLFFFLIYIWFCVTPIIYDFSVKDLLARKILNHDTYTEHFSYPTLNGFGLWVQPCKSIVCYCTFRYRNRCKRPPYNAERAVLFKRVEINILLYLLYFLSTMAVWFIIA